MLVKRVSTRVQEGGSGEGETEGMKEESSDGCVKALKGWLQQQRPQIPTWTHAGLKQQAAFPTSLRGVLLLPRRASMSNIMMAVGER